MYILCTYVCKYIYMCVCVCICVCVYIYISMYVYIFVCLCAWKVYVCAYINNICIYL